MITVTTRSALAGLAALPAALTVELAAVQERAAQRVWADAQAPGHVPFDTGRLHDTATLDLSTPLRPLIVYPQEYAGFLHWGTIRLAPRPWLQAAMDRDAAAYQGDLAGIAARIGAVWRGL